MEIYLQIPNALVVTYHVQGMFQNKDAVIQVYRISVFYSLRKCNTWQDNFYVETGPTLNVLSGSHYGDGIMGTMTSQITSLTIVYSTMVRSKKTFKLRVTGLCAGNSPGSGEFPAQMASNAENVSIWWRHHENKDIFDAPNHTSCRSYSKDRR